VESGHALLLRRWAPTLSGETWRSNVHPGRR
jgi:hypothetical protein